ncbi:hypothetical protein RJ639_042182 [Escallonia herrerae]|uniref:Programmed cell death protein 7 n=1 Tax=Escallonia herrerae TaxID=1293975 RepID=A0AA89B2C7_9ASTE|nr:hypothetical protein RJ639_042182 [Escallonia herrerae]
MAPPHWYPVLPPLPPMSSAFWNTANVHDRLQELRDTLYLAKAMQKELDTLIKVKDGKGSNETTSCVLSKYLEDNRIDLASQESLSLEAASALITKLRVALEPFKVVTDDASPWEDKSGAVRLAQKLQKNKRNKLWRKRKRKRVAEGLAKERERFEQADQEADEWRAREIAKDIAKRKVDKMKEIAKLKAKEERRKAESELELVLIVEKLQELRSIRIQKLKRQGHFLPEEDDKFLERVRAAVEEEERQAMAAADKDAAKDAIVTAEESRKIIHGRRSGSEVIGSGKDGEESQDQITGSETKDGSSRVTDKEPRKQGLGSSGSYDSVASLPLEFYHYYHGSNTDMGTLIEVRRAWDSYISTGGSRIPGHWVQPPPPADEIWASYLVKPA